MAGIYELHNDTSWLGVRGVWFDGLDRLDRNHPSVDRNENTVRKLCVSLYPLWTCQRSLHIALGGYQY
jgi:hypothetical protein